MSNTKTYVLLHGAWHGGWCWQSVAQQLRSEGHVVYTPTQTGLGERSHLLSKEISLEVFIQDLCNLIEWENLNNVVLVGHSFGGLAVSGAADRLAQRISNIVYLDAFLLENNQTVMSTLPEAVVQQLQQSAVDNDGGVSIPVPPAKAFGITDEDQAELIKKYCTGHPISTYETPMSLKNPIANGLPTTYVSVNPPYRATADALEYARKQADWRHIVIEAGHDLPLTAPDQVVQILLNI